MLPLISEKKYDADVYKHNVSKINLKINDRQNWVLVMQQVAYIYYYCKALQRYIICTIFMRWEKWVSEIWRDSPKQGLENKRISDLNCVIFTSYLKDNIESSLSVRLKLGKNLGKLHKTVSKIRGKYNCLAWIWEEIKIHYMQVFRMLPFVLHDIFRIPY